MYMKRKMFSKAYYLYYSRGGPFRCFLHCRAFALIVSSHVARKLIRAKPEKSGRETSRIRAI